jgi:DNA-binding MarR family transcriptional regulator
MDTTPQACAHEIIDVAPAIMQAIRVEMRAQGSHDLTVPQFRTLVYLRKHPGASLSAVAENIGLTLPTMSVLVEGLVQRDLILRVPDLRDRRRVLLSLTETGQALHARSKQAAEASIAEMLVDLSEEERAAIVRGLQVLRPLFIDMASANRE